MSDIPRARRILLWALAELRDIDDTRKAINRALRLMTREKPEFRAPHRRPKMTRDQVARAKQLRRAEMPVDDIAKHIGQNIGRVSEAINGKRKGV